MLPSNLIVHNMNMLLSAQIYYFRGCGKIQVSKKTNMLTHFMGGTLAWIIWQNTFEVILCQIGLLCLLDILDSTENLLKSSVNCAFKLTCLTMMALNTIISALKSTRVLKRHGE